MTTEDALKIAKDSLDQAIASKKQTQELLKNLGPVIVETLTPILEESNKRLTKGFSELAEAIKSIKVDAPAVPKAEVTVTIPEIKVPEPKVTVNVPKIEVPQIKVPEIKIPLTDMKETNLILRQVLKTLKENDVDLDVT